MRSLFILRGAPGSGKSTWIKENNLEAYTLSADQIRRQIQSPVMNEDGKYGTCQDNDTEVWKLLFNMLEKRMERGDLTIVDATHYKSSLISRYKDLEDKYRYRVYVVDFTNISEEEIIRRNNLRREEEIVPDEVISKMIISLKDDGEIKKAYKVLTPEDAIKLINSPLVPISLDEYEKVVIFGDIHGCYEPLKNYFKDNPFNDKTSYIFVGDYIDRGIQNKEVLQFLIGIYRNKNVALLEGNHEKWLKIYSGKDYNIENYKEDETTYEDLQAKKLYNLLKHYIDMYSSKVGKYKNLSDDIYKKKQEQGTDEIFYDFQKINALEKVREYNEEYKKCQEILRKLEYYKTILNYEKGNTTLCIHNIIGYLIENNLPYSLEIDKGILSKYGIKYKDVRNNPIRSSEFLKNTLFQISDINVADLRQLCRKFIQLSYFTFKGQKYLVTHGGLPKMPTIKTCTEQIIKGVGSYSSFSDIDRKFTENESDIISIHGHRNVFGEDAKITERAYNLNSEVEYGKPLRIMEITGHIEVKEYENTIFLPEGSDEEPYIEDPLNVLRDMVKDKYIQIKTLNDNIISINFTKEAFYSNKWNERTCKARGLFVDQENGNVVARSYNKFFNWGQTDSTKSPELKKTLEFPVKCWRKENGFLGLISKCKGKVRFFNKSSDDCDYVNWFIGILCDIQNIKYTEVKDDVQSKHTYTETYDNLIKLNKTLSEYTNNRKFEQPNNLDYDYIKELSDEIQMCKVKLDCLKDLLSERLKDKLEEGKTYIFECIDTIHDRHIIKYPFPVIFLLDIVTNDLLNPKFSDYEEILNKSTDLKVECKKLQFTFNTWEELYEWRQREKVSYDIKHEGWVIEDSNGYRVKMKSRFYTFWKEMRSVLNSLAGGRSLKKIYKTKEEILATKLMEELGRDKLKEMSIIDVEDMFYERYNQC